MNCLKCNKEIPYDHNLCGYCGNPIREKCSECGEMERIGIMVCEKKYYGAVRALNKYIIDNKKPLKAADYTVFAMSFSLLSNWLIAALLAVVYAFVKTDEIKNLSLAFFTSGVGMFIFSAICGFCFISKESRKSFSTDEKAKQEFFRLHPEYAEIIKQAEGEKK